MYKGILEKQSWLRSLLDPSPDGIWSKKCSKISKKGPTQNHHFVKECMTNSLGGDDLGSA